MANEEFKQVLSKINANLFFDEKNFLRETSSDTLDLVKNIEKLEEMLKYATYADQYIFSGTLGNLYRIYGNDDKTQLSKAKKHLSFCLKYAIKNKDSIKEVITLIRLGEVYKYNEQHEKALELFNKALSICEIKNIDQYIDFTYQHIGKCYLEMQMFECAETNLQQALKLRREKGDEILISSTLDAINLIPTSK